MRIHRVFTDQALQPEQDVVLRDGVAHYLSRVLRVSVGQQILLFNGDGADYVAEVSELARNSLNLSIRSRLPSRPESPLKITLVQAISRGERMDLSLQKATELGVSAFQAVFSQRSEVRLKPEKLDRRLEHWQKVIVSACEQSGRARVPALASPVDVMVWARQSSTAQRLLLEPDSETTLASIGLAAELELLVGPEGGFSDEELDFVTGSGVQPVSLGPRILRTETAGPAAIAVIQARAGDFV